MRCRLAMCVIFVLPILTLPQPLWAAGSPFGCKSIAENFSASIRTQPEQIPGAKSFVYREIDGTPLRLHVFSPPYHDSSKKAAAIIFFFGGGWHFGTVWQFVPQAQYLAQRGMVAVVADYRVRCRHGSSPSDSMADARTALAWIHSHADTLGVDRTRIAASGGSAGGHLAVSAALFDELGGESNAVRYRPSALVLFNPGLDVTAEGVREITTSLGLDSAASRAISPLHHLIKGLPPTLILQGQADAMTTYSAATQFCHRARALRSECKVVGYEGAEHGFFNAPDAGLPQNPDNPEKKTPSDHYRQTLFEADQFLTHLGYFRRATISSADRN